MADPRVLKAVSTMLSALSELNEYEQSLALQAMDSFSCPKVGSTSDCSPPPAMEDPVLISLYLEARLIETLSEIAAKEGIAQADLIRRYIANGYLTQNVPSPLSLADTKRLAKTVYNIRVLLGEHVRNHRSPPEVRQAADSAYAAHNLALSVLEPNGKPEVDPVGGDPLVWCLL